MSRLTLYYHAYCGPCGDPPQCYRIIIVVIIVVADRRITVARKI